jgi:hypothetical protein
MDGGTEKNKTTPFDGGLRGSGSSIEKIKSRFSTLPDPPGVYSFPLRILRLTARRSVPEDISEYYLSQGLRLVYVFRSSSH